MTISAVVDAGGSPPSVRVDVASPVGTVMTSVQVFRADSDGKRLVREQPVPGFESRQVFDFEMRYGEPVTYSWVVEYLTEPSKVWVEPWADLDDWSVSGAGWGVDSGALVWSGAPDEDASVSRVLPEGSYRVVFDSPPSGVTRVRFSDSVWVDVARSRLCSGGSEVSFEAGSGSWVVDVTGTGIAITTSAGSASVEGLAVADRVAFEGVLRQPLYERQWGPLSTLAGGVATDSAGNVYVADTNQGVKKFDANGSLIGLVGAIGGAEGYSYAADVFVDTADSVYVVDVAESRVQKYDSSGDFVMTIGASGTGDGQFVQPVGVCVDSTGNIYVVSQDGRIQKFDSDGAYVAKWSQSAFYGNIRLDGDGNLWAFNGLLDTVYKYSTTGTLLDTWTSGTNPELDYPRSVAFDGDGNILMLNMDANSITRYTSAGVQVDTIGTTGNGNGQFNAPRSLTITGDTLYVLDSGNGRVQKFVTPPVHVGEVTVSDFGDIESATETADPVTITPDDAWLIHPSKPPLSFRIGETDPNRAAIAAIGPIENESTATLHDILGSDRPVTTTSGDRREDTLEMHITTVTHGEELALKALLKDQVPILVRVPPAWGIDFMEGFYSVGRITRQRLAQIPDYEARRFILPMTLTDSPAVLVEQASWSFAAVALEFDNFDTLTDTFATFADLAVNART